MSKKIQFTAYGIFAYKTEIVVDDDFPTDDAEEVYEEIVSSSPNDYPILGEPEWIGDCDDPVDRESIVNCELYTVIPCETTDETGGTDEAQTVSE